MSFDSIFGIFQGAQTLFATSQSSLSCAFSSSFSAWPSSIWEARNARTSSHDSMGLGMSTVNAAVMFFDPLSLHGGMGTLFIEPTAGSALRSAAAVAGNAAAAAANCMLPPISCMSCRSISCSQSILSCSRTGSSLALCFSHWILARCGIRHGPSLHQYVPGAHAELGTIAVLL